MCAAKLIHHLRAHRKTFGLSQTEIAILLGCQNGAKVSKYENFNRLPALPTAVAYEIILGVSLQDLFPGVYAKEQSNVARRAKQLKTRWEKVAQINREHPKHALIETLIVFPTNSQ